MSTHVLAPADPALRSTLAQLNWLLGVDGGGTGTRVRLADRSGKTLGQGEAGPSALGQGADQAWRNIQQAAAQAAQAAGLAAFDPSQCAIGLGLSGISHKERVSQFLSSQPGYAVMALDGDGWTTMLGAHGGEPGAVLAAGTGTVGEALRRDGSRAFVSGWGWVTGDEGSGAWLGLKAIRHAEQAFDGRATLTPLADAVLARVGKERGDIVAWNAQAGQTGFAALAPLVFDAAEAGCATAESFLAEAVTELEKLVHAMDPQGDLPVALSGSIALRLAPRFSAALIARIRPAQGDSAQGGLHLVRNELTQLGT
jgi:glucosamine kinase